MLPHDGVGGEIPNPTSDPTGIPQSVYVIPVAGGDHFTITHELRDADGQLTQQLLLLG